MRLIPRRSLCCNTSPTADTMPLIRSKTSLPPYALRRSRGAGPSCRGGVSSVLRLGQATLPLLPMARTLAQRMAAALPSVPPVAP